MTIPITIQWTTPDYFAGHYYTVFLSYTIKELLASACISKQRDNRPVPIATKGANTFFHSVVIGGSWLFPFGVYLQGGFDFPLRPSNNLSAYYAQRTSDHIDGHGLKDYRCLLCLGIDITMLIRACYGMSFNNSNPKITDL